MKKIIITLLLLSSGFLSYAQSAFRQPADATECTRMLFQAIIDKDGNTLGEVLANDFSIISFQGREINREFLIGSITKGYLAVDSGMLYGLRTRNFNDVTIVTGSWNVKAKAENASLQGELAFMAVCSRTAGNWKVSMMQLTPVQ